MTNRTAWIMAVLLAALAAVAGCGPGAPESGTGQAATGATGGVAEGPARNEPPLGGGHADASVVPGSHEDWCDEHAVPETACTRCDASLIPAFKTVGDWCDEHGLPKSQCLKCDPTLKIVRPPKTGGS